MIPSSNHSKAIVILRAPRPGAYSIEMIFAALREDLMKAGVQFYEVGSRWRALVDVWRLRRMPASVYHVTGDIHYVVLFLLGKKTVLTIHDIGHFLYGTKGWRRWIYKWLWLKLPLMAATGVTAVSEATKQHIVEHLGAPRARIRVIQNCYAPRFRPAPRVFNAACPTILQVGTRPYKNVPRLVEALYGIKCRLILLGAIDPVLAAKLQEWGGEYEAHEDLTHDEVYRWYVECDMVSFVSIGEGFGVPIIEANATGRPVITSNVPPMCDVAGDAACLVSPTNVEDIKNGILSIFRDGAYRARLVEAGFKNAARFSAANVAREYLDFYDEVATDQQR